MKLNIKKYSFENMDEFTHKLRNEDKRNHMITKNMKWVMLVFTVLYSGIGLLDSDSLMRVRIGYLFAALGFALFAIIMWKLNKEYRSVDYGVPLFEMLTQVVVRYKLFHKKVVWSIAPVLCIDIGMVLMTLEGENIFRNIILQQALIFGTFSIGLTIGTMIWRKRQKPLRDAALEMLAELQ